MPRSSPPIPTPGVRPCQSRLSSQPSFSNWIGLSAEADLAPDAAAHPSASPPAAAWDQRRQQQQERQQPRCSVDAAVADIMSNYAAGPGGWGFAGAGSPASPLDRLLERLDRDRPAAMMFNTGGDWQLGGRPAGGST